MWGTVLGLALIAACEPVRLGMAVFLVSGPRPLVNLRAFWLGGMTMGALGAFVVLVVLRDVGLTIVHSVASGAASSTARHFQLAGGIIALLIAALLVGVSVRQRAPASLPGRAPSARELQPRTPTIFSRLSSHSQDAFEGGVPWLALVGGLCLSMPPAEYAVAMGAILASGAAPGTQISAVAVFAVVSFVIFEIPLISYLVKPEKTRAIVLTLHDWVRARRRWILAVIIGVAGVVLVANGIGAT